MPVNEMTGAIDLLYGGCDCHTLPDLQEPDPELVAAIEAMMRQVWKDKGMPPGLVNEEVISLFADRLWNSVVEGYGNDLPAFDWDTPDYRMLKMLEDNVWQFSAAKNYQQLRELSTALIGPDGRLRSESAFFEEAFKINDRHVRSWLATERELAVASGQMASKWVDIQENKSILPLVQFDVVMDAGTTELCQSLNDVIVPVDHPYLRIYYPPNHYKCRTTVRQLASGVVSQNLPYPEIPKAFQNNLAATGKVFPDGHGYFVDVPDQVKITGQKLKNKSDG